MKKAKIYKPSKTAMQSGLKKFDKWVIEFITEDPGKNPLMGWESSSDTYSELNLEFVFSIMNFATLSSSSKFSL